MTERRDALPDGLDWPTRGVTVEHVDGEVWIVTPSGAYALAPEAAQSLGSKIRMLGTEAQYSRGEIEAPSIDDGD